jgi:LacI family transcriptional regulator
MRALYKLKKKIPEEVAVLGFCEEPFRSLYNPAITSIEPKGFEIGQMAVEILLDRIENTMEDEYAPRIMYLEADLIVKNST